MTTEQEKETFFTIIIPTRERADTLVHALQTVLTQDYENFEILVSDNASLDDTAKKVAAIKNPRLRYVNTGHRISMSENWEFALSHVKSGWVTVLGDDDAILPGSLNKVNQIINKTGTEAIRSNGCSYSWPGLSDSHYGRLRVSLKRGYEIRDSGRMLQLVINGSDAYTELPVLYNGGFISIELIKRAKKKTGNFFQSMTPDVYSGIIFSLLTENYVYSYEPLAINGASLHSGGTAGFEKIKKVRIYDPAEKFWREKNIPLHKDIPPVKTGRPVRSISVCVYEAYLQAKPFHDLKKISTSHEKQLAIALRTSGPDAEEIVEWATLFSKKHQIEFSEDENKIYRHFFRGGRLLNFINMFLINGSSEIPLLNVYDASIVAGFVKNSPPSLLKRLNSLYRALILRIAKRWVS